MTEDDFKKTLEELEEFDARPSPLTEEDRLKIAKECGPPGYDPTPEGPPPPTDPGTDGGAP